MRIEKSPVKLDAMLKSIREGVDKRSPTVRLVAYWDEKVVGEYEDTANNILTRRHQDLKVPVQKWLIHLPLYDYIEVEFVDSSDRKHGELAKEDEYQLAQDRLNRFAENLYNAANVVCEKLEAKEEIPQPKDTYFMWLTCVMCVPPLGPCIVSIDTPETLSYFIDPDTPDTIFKFGPCFTTYEDKLPGLLKVQVLEENEEFALVLLPREIQEPDSNTIRVPKTSLKPLNKG